MKIKINFTAKYVLVVISKFFAKFFHRHKFEDRPTIDRENSAYLSRANLLA